MQAKQAHSWRKLLTCGCTGSRCLWGTPFSAHSHNINGQQAGCKNDVHAGADAWHPLLLITCVYKMLQRTCKPYVYCHLLLLQTANIAWAAHTLTMARLSLWCLNFYHITSQLLTIQPYACCPSTSAHTQRPATWQQLLLRVLLYPCTGSAAALLPP